MTAEKILFLGDSFTVGTGLGQDLRNQTFPYRLAAKIREAGLAVKEPKIYAVDGDTTKHLLGSLNQRERLTNPDEPERNPDHPDHDPQKPYENTYDYGLVTLSIGINDLFRGHTIEDYRHHFKELLERAIHLSGDRPGRVLVMSIPAWDASPSVHDHWGTEFRGGKYAQVRRNASHISVPIEAIELGPDGATLKGDSAAIAEQIERAVKYNTREGIALAINEFNGAARGVIEEMNANLPPDQQIHWVNITPMTRKDATITEDGISQPDASMFAKDGIHYSGKMYDKWAELAMPEIKKALGIEEAVTQQTTGRHSSITKIVTAATVAGLLLKQPDGTTVRAQRKKDNAERERREQVEKDTAARIEAEAHLAAIGSLPPQGYEVYFPQGGNTVIGFGGYSGKKQQFVITLQADIKNGATFLKPIMRDVTIPSETLLEPHRNTTGGVLSFERTIFQYYKVDVSQHGNDVHLIFTDKTNPPKLPTGTVILENILKNPSIEKVSVINLQRNVTVKDPKDPGYYIVTSKPISAGSLANFTDWQSIATDLNFISRGIVSPLPRSIYPDVVDTVATDAAEPAMRRSCEQSMRSETGRSR